MSSLGINQPLLAPTNLHGLDNAPLVNNPPQAARQNPAAALTHPHVAQQQGAQRMPQVGIQQVAGHAVPQAEGFWGKVGRWFAEGSKGKLAGLPAQVTVALPGGGNIQLSGLSLAPMIKALPRLDRAEARNNLANTLATRLASAQTLLTDVMQGHVARAATKQEVSDLMLLMQVKAQSSGNGFSAGALSIEDGDGRLYGFLNSCPDKYLRSSSHMEDAQQLSVDGHRNIHRGIDTPSGVQGLLYGNATTLFAAIPGDGNNEPRRLFFKPESHGARLSTLSRANFQAGLEAGGAVRPWKAADIGTTIGHGFSFLATRGQGSAAGSRKERIPDSAKNAFKALQQLPSLTGAQKNMLSEHDPLNQSHGIRTMLGNLQRIYGQLHTQAEQTQFMTTIAPLLDTLQNLPQITNLGNRIGNEVMLNMADLTTMPQRAPQTTAEKRTELENFIRHA